MAVGLVLCAAVVTGVSIARKNALYWEIYDMAIGKFANGRDSSVERMDAIATDISIFLHHPIFGAKIAQVLYATANNTISTLILFSAFGLPAALHAHCLLGRAGVAEGAEDMGESGAGRHPVSVF